MKLRELFHKNDEGKLILPDFQRDFEWDKNKQKSLLSSFITQLPVGSLLILEGKREHFAAKKLCFPTELKLEERKEECYYLLDGQQRISSLKTIFSDYFYEKNTWIETWESMYTDLSNRWFIRVTPKNGESDIFGWERLLFKHNRFKYEPVEVYDFIEYRKIFKTKTQDWHNPGYSPKDSNGKIYKGNRLKVEIAKHAAKNSLIPLYTIYNDDKNEEKPLHEYVIEQIKNNRIEELKAAVRDQELDIVDILEPVDPMISDYLDDEDKIRDAWSTLGARWVEQVNKFLNELLDQEMPIIQLPSDEISRAISIFENINEGGTDLNTFDLIVAKAARSGYSKEGSLSQRIMKDLEKEITLPESLCSDIIGERPNIFLSTKMKTIVDNKIAKPFKDMYLNLLSIVSHFNFGEFEGLRVDHIKRHKQLSLSFEEINSNTPMVIKSLIRALAFLNTRLGITELNKLSYELMILPIAYMLRDDHVWTSKEKLGKIEYWYWASIFGGAYREGQNAQSISDIKGLYSWIYDGENKFKYLFDKILEEEGYSDKNVLLLKDENKDLKNAVSLTILQYILSNQPKDFLQQDNEDFRLNAWDISNNRLIKKGEDTIQLELHDHHIIPLGDVTNIEESTKKIRQDKRHMLNSPLNRTYISSVANIRIRDKSPDKYLEYVSESSKWGHYIPEYCNETISNNYQKFLTDRYNELKKEIKKELEKLSE